MQLVYNTFITLFQIIIAVVELSNWLRCGVTCFPVFLCGLVILGISHDLNAYRCCFDGCSSVMLQMNKIHLIRLNH